MFCSIIECGISYPTYCYLHLRVQTMKSLTKYKKVSLSLSYHMAFLLFESCHDAPRNE